MTKKVTQIRQGVFETNSSSTHSISVASPADGDILDTLPLDENGNFHLRGGEFGWEIEDYTAAEDKANYAAIYAVEWSAGRCEEFRSILDSVIREQTGCNKIIYDFVEITPDQGIAAGYSYIDHQSVEGGELDCLFEEPELLRQFIFNRKSILHTDNDNY